MILDWHSHIYTPREAADDCAPGTATPVRPGRARLPDGAGELPPRARAEQHRHQRRHQRRPLPQGQAGLGGIAVGAGVVDYAAKVQQDHKGVLYSFATILPCGGPAFIKETERAIKQLGLKGIFIHSSHKGHYPDDDEARPFWELVQDLDVPVMIHPPHLGFGEERMRDYRLASSIGRPFDLCLALGRMIVRGVLEDFPRLKIVASHGGGGICETISRMDYAYELQDEAFFLGSYAPMKIKHAPSHYLKMMYLDTVCYNRPAVKMVRNGWAGPRAVWQRRAAAHVAEAAGDQADPGPGYSRRRQGQNLLEQRAEVAQIELNHLQPWVPAYAGTNGGMAWHELHVRPRESGDPGAKEWEPNDWMTP